MSGAIWLSSYPRSGNTWARLALKSLSEDGAPVGINRLDDFGGVMTKRGMFDTLLDVDSADLTRDEIANLRPVVHDLFFAFHPAPRLTKVHDRWFRNPAGRPVFDAAHTSGAIYLIRDPRDVAVSWARFSATSIDVSIAYLADREARLADSRAQLYEHIPQWLGSWSEHAASWIDDSGLMPLVVRYEDMIADHHSALARMAAYLGWTVDDAAIARAAAATAFDELSEEERRHGFAELPDSAQRFFVAGRAGGWRDVLSAAQSAAIERDHAAVMRRFGYL